MSERVVRDAHETTLETTYPRLIELLSEQRPIVAVLAKRQYGHQTQQPGQHLWRHLRRDLPASNSLKWYEMNMKVTSGVTPGGHKSGFDRQSRTLTEKLQKDAMEAEGQGRLDLSRVLVRTRMVSLLSSAHGLSAC